MPTAPASTDASQPAQPATCNVLGWVVFWPGFWKGQLYTPQMCARLPVNFATLVNRRPHAKLGDRLPTEVPDGTDPGAKLGHDPQQLLAQRLKASSGFISIGDVTRCEEVPGYPGHIEIDVRNVPTRLVGGEISAGRYNGGSVELKDKTRDPNDPAREIPGPILTGVAFLGEEPPALQDCHPDLQVRTRPTATFDDGSPVPANPEPPAELVSAMSDVMHAVARKFSAELLDGGRRLRVGGREFSDRTVCFSDFTPTGPTMTPEEIKAKLVAAGKTPEEIDAILAALGAPATTTAAAGTGTAAPAVPPTSPTMADMCKKYADDPAATPEQKMMAAMYSDFSKKFADMESKSAEDKKRIGELQASAEAQQKATADAQMAAFSAEVDRVVEGEYKPTGECVRPGLSRKVPPVARPALKKLLTDLYGPGVKAFSSEADRVKAFSDHVASLANTPDNPSLVGSAPGKAVDGPSRLSSTGLKVLAAIRDVNPRVYEKHAAATA